MTKLILNASTNKRIKSEHIFLDWTKMWTRKECLSGSWKPLQNNNSQPHRLSTFKKYRLQSNFVQTRLKFFYSYPVIYTVFNIILLETLQYKLEWRIWVTYWNFIYFMKETYPICFNWALSFSYIYEQSLQLTKPFEKSI